MKRVKGFVNIQPFADNDRHKTSPLGELTQHSKTYSTDVGHYSKNDYPEVDLFTFAVRDDLDQHFKLTSQWTDTILAIAYWSYVKSLSGIFTKDRDTYVSALLSEYDTVVTDVTVGTMVDGPSGSILPEFVSFQLIGVGDNIVKLWFADEAFQNQYDEYEIVVVPPIDNLNDFFKTAPIVKGYMDQLTKSKLQQRIEELRNEHPATLVRVESYEWSAPIDRDTVLSTDWAVIIYGAAGDNIDNIKMALSNFVLANSSYSRDDWVEYIPDLFKSTEYIIVPNWDEYSVPNETLVKGIQSPVSSFAGLLDKVVKFAPDYGIDHIQKYLNVTSAIYMQLGLSIVGGPDNRDGVFDFRGRFEDYMVTATTAHDFSRMDQRTREWVLLLSEQLRYADTMSEFSDIPISMTRLTRNGIMYLVASFEEIQYLVVSRQSYEELTNQ